MAPVNVLNMSPDEFKQFIDSFDYVFSDCDGVLWTAQPLPGVGEFFTHLERLGKPAHFVSNNSLRTKKNYQDLFQAVGIENGAERLTIPSIAIAEYLTSINFKKKVYCVTTAEAVNVLESYGLRCETGPRSVEVDDYETYFLQYLEDDAEIGAVVFDSDLEINLAKFYRAQSYLARPDVLFLAGATDRAFIFKPGRFDLGPSVFISLMEEQVGRRARVLGKPAALYAQFAMKRAGVTDPSRVLFMGDLIEQDVGLGRAAGFQTLLVLTNIPEQEMLASPVQPDYCAPSLASLLPQLRALH